MSSRLGRFLIRALYPPSVALNRLLCALGIWNRWDWIDDKVLLGAVPARRHIRELADLGITAIINLCDEFSGYCDEIKHCGMSQLHLPIVDYHCPDLGTLERGVEFLLDRAASGQKTYLHCKAGQGRSATLALCYLIAAYQLPPGDAYTRLKTARPNVNRRLDRWPTVIEFARRSAMEGRDRGQLASNAV